MIAERCVEIAAGRFVLILQVDENGRLFQRKLGSFEAKDDAQAFPAAGDGWVFEPALNVIHADGNTSTDLRVIAIKAEGNETTISLRDAVYPFELDLHFQAIPANDIIEAWSIVRHQEEGDVRLDAIASSSFCLGNSLHLTQFSGDWASEAKMVQEPILSGIKILDSKLGVRTHQFRAPWFLLSQGALKEEEGEVIAGSLAWSGSFRFSFESLPKGSTRVIAGINPFGSAYFLAPGETFETPKMVWAWSDQGAGAVSRNLHAYVRRDVMRDGDRERAILLNNWEATYFDFDEAKIVSLFQGAKELGMELFLLDDGWFGVKYPRDGDTQGLGDWDPDPKKLPNGVGALPDAAEKEGLRFGIWVEPEMVNPRSALFEEHPDWVIRQPHRELELQRNQLALDLSNPDVREFAFGVVDNVLKENPGISYVKWDCNRYLTQPGSPYLPANRQSHLQIECVRGLYEVFRRVSEAHPNVELMVCSGGGGRVDYAALGYAHELWPSDMTDPVQRIFIQWGFSHFMPAMATAAHVTRWGERPLKFCFDVAMSARLGMDVDVDHLSEADREFSRNAIATYKSIRDVVQLGDQYRLESPYEGSRASLMFVKDNRAIVFVYASEGAEAKPLQLRGLDPAVTYTVQEINRLDGSRSLASRTGAELLDEGLQIETMAPFGSQIFELVGN